MTQQAYTAFELESSSFSRACFAESLEIWNSKVEPDSRTKLASALFLHLGCVGHGSNHIAIEYIVEAFHMGKRMHILDSSTQPFSHTDTASDEVAERLMQATAHEAWGLYNWLT